VSAWRKEDEREGENLKHFLTNLKSGEEEKRRGCEEMWIEGRIEDCVKRGGKEWMSERG
jgi:hypothetical protein